MQANSVSDEERNIVVDILRKLLPIGSTVWIFGSRASGISRAGSDIDLAIDAGRTLSADEMTWLHHAFESSMLSYTVDIIDVRTIDGVFAENVIRERKLFLET